MELDQRQERIEKKNYREGETEREEKWTRHMDKVSE